MRCDVLKRLGSKSDFPDFASVQRLVDDADAGDESARKKVREL